MKPENIIIPVAMALITVALLMFVIYQLCHAQSPEEKYDMKYMAVLIIASLALAWLYSFLGFKF